MSNKDNSTSINKKVFDSKKYFIYAFKRHILNENKIIGSKLLVISNNLLRTSLWKKVFLNFIC